MKLRFKRQNDTAFRFRAVSSHLLRIRSSVSKESLFSSEQNSVFCLFVYFSNFFRSSEASSVAQSSKCMPASKKTFSLPFYQVFFVFLIEHIYFLYLSLVRSMTKRAAFLLTIWAASISLSAARSWSWARRFASLAKTRAYETFAEKELTLSWSKNWSGTKCSRWKSLLLQFFFLHIRNFFLKPEFRFSDFLTQILFFGLL